PSGEEFLVLDGELVDNDGTVFRTGDYVAFQPGTRHVSAAPGGCLLAVFMRGPNRLLDADEARALGGADQTTARP
ncbi:MAG: cupin domain-containing protein, partial [Alphaproteobacteria bacterium]